MMHTLSFKSTENLDQIQLLIKVGYHTTLLFPINTVVAKGPNIAKVWTLVNVWREGGSPSTKSKLEDKAGTFTHYLCNQHTLSSLYYSE